MSQTTVLDLEILTSQYSNLLIQYEKAVANYTAAIQYKNSPGSNKSLMNIQNNSFWGSGDLGRYVGGTAASCSALCLNKPKCSGATFNPNNKACNLRSGEGNLVPTANNIALLPQETYYLLNMQSINSQLVEINQKILTITNESQPGFDTQYATRKVKAEELLLNYIALNEEREKIDNMVKSYEQLNEDEIQGNINLSQNYSSFILLIILAVLLLVVIYMVSGSSTPTTPAMIPSQPTNQEGGQLGIAAYFIVFVIILTVLVIKYFSNISTFIKSFY